MWLKRIICKIAILKYLGIIFVIILIMVLIFLPGKLDNTWRFYRGHISDINSYFSEKETLGFQVNRALLSQTQLESDIFNSGIVTNAELYIWLVKEPDSGNFLEYEWILLPVNDTSLEFLRCKGIAVNGWWQSGVENYPHGGVGSTEYPGLRGYKSILLPLNEQSLSVHLEIGLRLPQGYELSN